MPLQDTFETKLMTSSSGHRTRLVCVPKFATTRCVLASWPGLVGLALGLLVQRMLHVCLRLLPAFLVCLVSLSFLSRYHILSNLSLSFFSMIRCFTIPPYRLTLTSLYYSSCDVQFWNCCYVTSVRLCSSIFLPWSVMFCGLEYKTRRRKQARHLNYCSSIIYLDLFTKMTNSRCMDDTISHQCSQVSF